MNLLKKNHFDLFGLTEAFEIDPAQLDSAYRRVQGAVHPDRFAAGSDTERRIAMQLATHANEAYRALRDPVQRAIYLCTLHGEDPQAHSNTAMSTEFLTHQMEWRERLDEGRDSRSHESLRVLRNELDSRRDELFNALADAIDVRGDHASAADLVRELMFVERFGTEVDAADETLGAH